MSSHFSIVVLAILAAAGCRGAGFVETAKPQSPIAPLVERQESPTSATSSDKQTEEEPAAQTQEEALAKVLEKLTETGALDANSKRELMADLREAKQENWPLIVRQFQAALAFREQLLAREEKAAAQQLAAEQKTERIATKPSARLAVNHPTDSRPQAVPVSFRVQPAEPPHRLSGKFSVDHQPSEDAEPSDQVVTTNKNPLRAVAVKPAMSLVLSKPPQQDAQHVSFVTNAEQPRDWHGHLQHAVHDLQSTVQSAPASTDEVNQHLRLRLLQLLAGDEEAALQPVPGATAPQQDYWNKQLFAVSTYLDNQRQPNDRRRAAGSLMHLDQARAKLSELATLEVRKLALVDSVEGYGVYKTHEKTTFRPGDVVTLYAEIENFSSLSTKEGYRTRLGTSYEIVDKNGIRVDSAEFPEVEDLCQNPRRDFHMQYTVTLPTRIYAEKYEIKLIVTDQQSHKIGQASIPFEIVE